MKATGSANSSNCERVSRPFGRAGGWGEPSAIQTERSLYEPDAALSRQGVADLVEQVGLLVSLELPRLYQRYRTSRSVRSRRGDRALSGRCPAQASRR